MNIPEATLLNRLERSRKAYQTALIEVRLAEDASRELHNADGVHSLSSARHLLTAATHEYQNALQAFADFALSEVGKRTRDLGAG